MRAFRWATNRCCCAGVNDDAEVMKVLVQKLLRCRVRPYYLYQCDLIQGSSHLRTPVSKGLEIIENLRGHTSGYAIPQYVIDGPGGGGKIPLNPNYLVAQMPDRIVLRNYKGDIFEYPEVAPAEPAAAPAPAHRHLAFLDPIEEREEITSRSWRAGRRD